MDAGSVPFFHQPETHTLVEDIASRKKLTVYAGAGVTIDKSGLDWSGLVDGLLAPHIADPEVRRELIRSQGPARAASIACEIYKDLHGGSGWRLRVRDALRVLLYAPGNWQQGLLAENLASLLFAWNSKSDPDYAACVVTPNYDDYIVGELARGVSEGQPDAIQPGFKVLFPDSSFRKLSLPTRKYVACVQLHGFVPSVSTSQEYGHEPVVSEDDYFESEVASQQTLCRIFENSDLLIVGASMTDPPLLRALLASKSPKRKRYAVMPLQGMEWEVLSDAGRSEIKRHIRERFLHFGVTAVFPDYYFQVGQLLQEIVTCLTNSHAYTHYLSPIRYGSRLVDWWARWSAQNLDPSSRQAEHHGWLKDDLVAIRQKLGAAADEALKLEVWLRWTPVEARKLRLWASSVGTWPDLASMREDTIHPSSRYASVAAFCYGRPTLAAAAPDDAPMRWKAFLSTPIWLEHSYGRVPVGIITLASMRALGEGSISDRNRARLAEILPLLQDSGQSVIAVEWEPIATSEEVASSD